jgi:hypothetical protein
MRAWALTVSLSGMGLLAIIGEEHAPAIQEVCAYTLVTVLGLQAVLALYCAISFAILRHRDRMADDDEDEEAYEYASR